MINQEWKNTLGCLQLGLIVQVCACFLVLHELQLMIAYCYEVYIARREYNSVYICYIVAKYKFFDLTTKGAVSFYFLSCRHY